MLPPIHRRGEVCEQWSGTAKLLRPPHRGGADAGSQARCSLPKRAERQGYERAVRGLNNALPEKLKSSLDFESSQELLNISRLRAEVMQRPFEDNYYRGSPWRKAIFAQKNIFEDEYINDWHPEQRRRSPPASVLKDAAASHARHLRKAGALWSTPPHGIRIAIKRIVSDDAHAVY